MPKIGIIQISVSDMDRAIDWYCENLGFAVSKDHYHYPVAVDLVHEGCRLLLHRADRSTDIDYPHVSQTLICFETNDIAKSLDNLKHKGVELIHDTPQEFPAGLYAGFRDPFGNVHEFVEFR